jgi:hypothetical protein
MWKKSFVLNTIAMSKSKKHASSSSSSSGEASTLPWYLKYGTDCNYTRYMVRLK